MDISDTYKNKRVFLTGHTGFKGSWLLTWLNRLGAETKGYALPPEADHRLFDQVGGGKMGCSIFGDVLDYRGLEKALLDFQPDFVFHLAAQPIVRTSYELPLETLAVNAMGTANLLNIIRRVDKVCSVIVVTTDKVYQNHEWAYAYRESDHLGGHDPYSASKACAEIIINSYRSCFFNPQDYERHKKSVAVARAGNVIGGGDWARDRILPDCIRALQGNHSIPIRNPHAVRPWQHVIDALYAYLLLGKKTAEDPVKYATAYNFGPLTTDCLQVEKIVAQVVDTWGSGRYHLVDVGSKHHEAGLLQLDISKAESELKWHPVFSATEAVRMTVEWYKKFDGHNARELILGNIDAFMARLIQ
jgi:CDP-glucose 4,6-dehydratase